MRRLLALFILMSVSSGPLLAAEVTKFQLANGMDVIVLEDHRAPVVVHMVWYRVGAAEEPLGKSGIAHFLEHLLFKGTDTREAGEFSATVSRNGGSDNAFTSWDYTAYFQRIAADRLGLMMEMEADRMRNLQMTQEDVATERDVVLEERNQRTDSDPSALFQEQQRAAQFLNHPYAIPVIGWRHEIEQLNRDDAFAFYEKYYAPNNAILVVAGDVAPDDVRKMAEQYYGPIRPTADLPERIRPQEPPQLSERRLHLSDPRVAQAYITRSYLAPERNAGDQREAAKLTLLAELLGGNSATSVLGRKLQFDTQQAIYSSAFYGGVSLDDATFGLVMVPVPGMTLAEGEAALDNAVQEFLSEGIDIDQFDRVKMQLRASQIYAEDSIQSLANRYGRALTSGLTIEDIQAWPEILQTITTDEVMDAANAIFDKNKAVTGWVSPSTATEDIQ